VPRTDALHLTDEAAPATPKPARTVADSPPRNGNRANGFYLGDDGRFANKVEIRRFNRSSSRGDDDEESSAGGSSSLLKRAVGLLGGKDGNQLAGTEAADTAGVAVGSSFWMAAKEAKGMADEVKEALSERDISSTKRAKAYAKDKALKLWGALKRPFGGQAGSEPGAGDATPDTPPATPANAANAEPKPASTIGIGEKKNQEQTESARLDAIRRKEDAQSKEQHSEVIDRLDALIDSSKTKPRSLTDVVGDKVKDWIGERGDKRGRKGRKGTKGRGKRPFGRTADRETGPRRKSRQSGPERARSSRLGVGRTTRASDLPDLPSSRREPGRTPRRQSESHQQTGHDCQPALRHTDKRAEPVMWARSTANWALRAQLEQRSSRWASRRWRPMPKWPGLP